MPTLDDLNEIKSQLLEIGDEPAILAEKGETPVDIGPPETGIPEDLNDLFDDFDEAADSGSSDEDSTDTGSSEQGSGLDDFNFDLDDEPAFDMEGFDAPDDLIFPEAEDDENDEPVSALDEDSGIIDETEIPETPEEAGFIPEEPDLEEDLADLTEGPDDLFDEIGDSVFAPEEDVENEEFGDIPGLSDDDLFPGEEDVPAPDFGEEPDADEDLSGFMDQMDETDFSPEEAEGDEFEVPDLPDESFDLEDEDFSFSDEPSDGGFEDLVGFSEDDLPSESEPPEDSEDFGAEDTDFQDTEDIDLDESISTDNSGFDLSEDGETGFEDEDSFSGAEDLAAESFNLEDEEFSFEDTDALTAGSDVDLSGEADESFDFDDAGDIDLDLPADDIDLGEGGEFSFDDTEDEAVGLDDFEIRDEGLDDDLELDEFNLGDLGQDFGVLEDDVSDFDSGPDAGEDQSFAEEELQEEELEITEEAFERIKANLQRMPRNLKLIIEEQIGEKGLHGSELKKLLDALAGGKPAKEIAAITGRIIGKKIKIPAFYEKKSGLEFEDEKDSFSYTLRHNILPLVRIFAVGAIAIAALGYVGYRFVYKPVHAFILYNRGYEELTDSRYELSSDTFDLAQEKYIFRKQFYRFAEGYVEREQWEYARKKYDRLLELYPADKKGTMDYARMEYEKLADYEHSTELLENFLLTDKNERDYDALLLLGDINLEWGYEDPSRYEEARLAYARIMGTYGVENNILFRMLRYFIRTDNPKEVEILKRQFQADEKVEIDPSAYAELAGYQIERDDLDDVQELLFRAKDVDGTIPEIHYQLARYFRKTDDRGEESKALSRTLDTLARKSIMNRRETEIKIDTLRREGEVLYSSAEYLQAEESYMDGIELLEKSRNLSLLKGRSRDFGRLYSGLGDIYYNISENLDQALYLYEKAEEEGLHTPAIYYNKGYIRYRKEDFKQALLDFYNAAGSFSVNPNLLYATANTLYQRNDLFAAQGYYNHTLDILEQKLNSEFTIQLDTREDHKALVENLMRANNNMGVTLYGLYRRTGDPSKYSSAMVSLTKSSEYFDDLSRDPETLGRTDTVNLASLNQRKLLYPMPDYELQIYMDIPKNLNR